VAVKIAKPLTGDFPTKKEILIIAEEVRRALEVSYARASGRIEPGFTDNVVKVLDMNMRPVLRFLAGRQPYMNADDYRKDPPYIVMEYVPGGSITDNRGTILATPKMFLCTVRQMVGAVKFVTGALREKVHGDVKPDNILVRSSGPLLTPVLTDFGTSINVTWEGWLYGTPEYMAPEGLLYPVSDVVSASYDTYSLGLTIYEILTGEVPTTQSLLIAVSRHPLLEPDRRSPHIARLSRSCSEPPGHLITAVERVVYGEQSPTSEEIAQRLGDLDTELEQGRLSHIRSRDIKILEESVKEARQPPEIIDLVSNLTHVSPSRRPDLSELLKEIDSVIAGHGIECGRGR